MSRTVTLNYRYELRAERKVQVPDDWTDEQVEENAYDLAFDGGYNLGFTEVEKYYDDEEFVYDGSGLGGSYIHVEKENA